MGSQGNKSFVVKPLVSRTVSSAPQDTVMSEAQRKHLISIIVPLMGGMPREVKEAAMVLVGWLARRREQEKPCQRGVQEARKQVMRLAADKR